MFFYKAIKGIKREIEELKTKVKQLECPHDFTNIIIKEKTYYEYAFTFKPVGEKICYACGKQLKIYSNISSLLTDRNELMKQLIKKNEQEIKG